MRSQVTVRSARRILCIYPRYGGVSITTFHYAYPLTDGVRAMMTPLGLLVIAGYLPDSWEVRFVDENISQASDADFAWADAVLVSGMHVQHSAIVEVCHRARAHGKPSALGGPSVSSSPERYPEFDYLHVGELGDATDELIRALDADLARPEQQRVFTTRERLPITDFPVPAYELSEASRYLLCTIQSSSGCPYTCEYCDIPALYGRQPRLKRPEQVLAELDTMLVAGGTGAVFFVDDNFIGNKKAARELLPHIIAWQKARGYPLMFSCEATLNIAVSPEILAMMREAYFVQVFCGLESPELTALDAMQKSHNYRALPILDAVATINSYGVEVCCGIILGLDTDTAATADAIVDFAEAAHVPLLNPVLLEALPKSPLWNRLTAAGRVDRSGERVSNVIFTRSDEEVVADWRNVVRRIYAPEAVYRRFDWNFKHTYPNRIRPPLSRARLSAANLRRGLVILLKLVTLVGIFGYYRRLFWRMALSGLSEGLFYEVLSAGFTSHHLIRFAEDCARQRAGFLEEAAQPVRAVARPA
jgi:radical SAM superfamily enzyme YgiQ (UPF0313 family)